jgi:cytochrome b subunit of formate dehydrogenase
VPVPLLRNARSPRRIHAGLYLTTGFLLLSGISVAGEGHPVLADLIGGHVAAAGWHRWVGFGLIGAGLLLPVLRPRATLRFLAESVRFHPSDLRWFAAYPGFVFSPRRHDPARHEGHFDPGQRVLNCLIILSLAALSVTGIVMSVPERVTPAAFAVSFKIHVVATVVLAALVGGHVLVASGLLPAYRGVWRAMHGGGRVSTDLARRLWPVWAEEHEGRARPAPGETEANQS